MITLTANEKLPIAKGYIFYNADEKGMDTYPDIKSDFTLQGAYIQIGFDSDTMCANQVFGLSPFYSWRPHKLAIPKMTEKCSLMLEQEMYFGSKRLDRENEWETYFDSETGWVCIGNPEEEGTTNVNFISNAIAVLNSKRELKSLWIKPVFKTNKPLTF